MKLIDILLTIIAVILWIIAALVIPFIGALEGIGV